MTFTLSPKRVNCRRGNRNQCVHHMDLQRPGRVGGAGAPADLSLCTRRLCAAGSVTDAVSHYPLSLCPVSSPRVRLSEDPNPTPFWQPPPRPQSLQADAGTAAPGAGRHSPALAPQEELPLAPCGEPGQVSAAERRPSHGPPASSAGFAWPPALLGRGAFQPERGRVLGATVTRWRGPRREEPPVQHGPGLPSALVCSELPRPTCRLGRVRTG